MALVGNNTNTEYHHFYPLVSRRERKMFLAPATAEPPREVEKVH